MKLIKFPSIEQYRSIVTQVTNRATYGGLDESGEVIRLENVDMPKIKFVGTVKLHGTNAGVSYQKSTDTLWANSRSRVITPINDNAGFADYVNGRQKIFINILNDIYDTYNIPENHVVTIFGEWCGKGVQGGVALDSLEKMFVVFGIKVTILAEDADTETDEGYWVNHNIIQAMPENKLYNILDYQTFEIEIDFNKPEEALETLTDLTLKVEKECPVAKEFGVTHLNDNKIEFILQKGAIHSKQKMPKIIEKSILQSYDRKKLIDNKIYFVKTVLED